MMQKISSKHCFRLKPKAPYDFELTIGCMMHFQTRYSADVFENGVYIRVLEIKDHSVLVKIRCTGTVLEPELEVEIHGRPLEENTVIEIRKLISFMLAIENDLSDFYKLSNLDPYISSIIGRLKGLQVTRSASVYEALVSSILGQQINTDVAALMRARFVHKFGICFQHEKELYRAFPSPHTVAAATIEQLMEIKFSRRKAEYILDISRGLDSGELDLDNLQNKGAADIVRELTKIRGVGEWTANLLLIRAYGNSDGFPHGDLAIQKTMGKLINGKDSAALSSDAAKLFSERWRPYRSYATMYLFGASRLGLLS